MREGFVLVFLDYGGNINLPMNSPQAAWRVSKEVIWDADYNRQFEIMSRVERLLTLLSSNQLALPMPMYQVTYQL